MKLLPLFLLVVVSLSIVIPASAVETQCFIGIALVANETVDQDQTIDVRAGIVYEDNRNLYNGPLGESVEVLPYSEVTIRTPETQIPVTATYMEIYLSDSNAGKIDQTIVPCETAPEVPEVPGSGGAGSPPPTFTDGRLNPNGADTAVIYASGGEYAVWGVDPSGHGFEAFTFTCAGLQEILDEAQVQANGNYLLESASAPGRSGDIQLWAVPGNGGDLGLVLVSPGQGGDNSKQTIVPLTSLCPDLS